MLEAWIQGEKRAPKIKGERTFCDCCQSELIAVIPIQNVPHWRHKAGDCDPWSEGETYWHKNWKEMFLPTEREIVLQNKDTLEFHRADVFCKKQDGSAVVLELQHSSISEEEREAREYFYSRDGRRLFWLLHIYDDEKSFRGWNFGASLDFSKPVIFNGHTFAQMRWVGRSRQFIERWKHSNSHVFFDFKGHIFYLATNAACGTLVQKQSKGHFALSKLSKEELISAVRGI